MPTGRKMAIWLAYGKKVSKMTREELTRELCVVKGMQFPIPSKPAILIRELLGRIPHSKKSK